MVHKEAARQDRDHCWRTYWEIVLYNRERKEKRADLDLNKLESLEKKLENLANSWREREKTVLSTNSLNLKISHYLYNLTRNKKDISPIYRKQEEQSIIQHLWHEESEFWAKQIRVHGFSEPKIDRLLTEFAIAWGFILKGEIDLGHDIRKKAKEEVAKMQLQEYYWQIPE